MPGAAGSARADHQVDGRATDSATTRWTRVRARVPVDSVGAFWRTDASVAGLGHHHEGGGPSASAPAATKFPLLQPDALRSARTQSCRAPLCVPSAARDTGNVSPHKQSDYPLTHRYDPLQRHERRRPLRKERPTWDGRGVTLASSTWTRITSRAQGSSRRARSAANS